MKHLAGSLKQTEETARALAPKLKRGAILLLHGNLGMGKTAFARALIRALVNDPYHEVPSPTFTLVQTYDTPESPIYHFDLYRLEDPEEIFELGWEDAISEGITIVEWPERLGPYKPAKSNAQILDITLSSVEDKPNARQILIEEQA